MGRNCLRHAMAFMAAATVLVNGCAMANFGSVRSSADVTRQFEEVEINPNYRYWYLNQENNPFGVLGIDREFAFEGGPHWRALDPDAATFMKIVGLVQRFPVTGSRAAGFEIMDSEGRQIGVWYSSLSAGVSVDSLVKKVTVSTPTPWIQPRL